MTTDKPDTNGGILTVKIYPQLRSYDRNGFYNTGPRILTVSKKRMFLLMLIISVTVGGFNNQNNLDQFVTA